MIPASFARRATALTLGGLLFILLATANSGGYRYGASDQAFYMPAIALSADATLFPRDRDLFRPQMQLWVGDSVLGWLSRALGSDLPAFAAGVYLVTLGVLFAAAIALARGMGASWPVATMFLVLLTFRHQITRTGANSLEGYMHPRMLAFALGIAAFAFVVRRRVVPACACLVLAGAVHTTTALWFAVASLAGMAWAARATGRLKRPMLILVAVVVAAAGSALLGLDRFSSRLTVMDQMWVDALGDRGYLFSGGWPVYAWLINLAYPVALVAIYRRRRRAGLTAIGEGDLVVGLVGLVGLFLLSVPLTEYRFALAVQLQVNRVFWLLDAVVALYVAWWLLADVGRRWSVPVQRLVVGALLLASAGRGAYLVQVAPGRPLVEANLARTSWTDAMQWLARQPVDWHVLADPQHVWRFGSSVRVAAHRDTMLEAGKDPSLAIYDRDLARRVVARTYALAGFDAFTTTDVIAVAAAYDLDVFVEGAGRTFAFPVLYRNDDFTIYDLR